jgi:hypothetical protein
MKREKGIIPWPKKLTYGDTVDPKVLPKEERRTPVHTPARKVKGKVQRASIQIAVVAKLRASAEIPVAVPPGPITVVGVT